MDWVAIVVSLSGAVAGLSGIITFFVNRHDNKKKNSFTEEEKNEILNGVRKINTIEVDTCRLQLLNLIQHSPKNTDAIFYQARHYFKELKGNSYMKSVVFDWAKAQGINEKAIEDLIKND